MQLSENFTLAELTRSAAAIRLKVRQQFIPPDMVVENLRELCTHVLQPLRDFIGGAIYVSSGYRCPEVNRAVGGASTSQHITGEAADISGLGNVTNKDLFLAILNFNLPFDQLIWEFGDDDEPAWVHVSFGPRNRREILQARTIKGKTVYTKKQVSDFI